jgi:thioredoxin 1
MTLRKHLPILVMCTVILISLGCSKEQPASKTPAQVAQAPAAQETTSVKPGEICDTVATAPAAQTQTPPQPARRAQAKLPRLVDLGRGTCIPCKKMAPILEELAGEYKGRAVVEVIDLRDRPGAAQEYGIKLIPTQVFFDEKGQEVWRHEGFLAKDQIVAKFQEMGVKPK